MEKIKVKFIADKVLISGPTADGSYKVSLMVGEYQTANIAPLVVANNVNIEVALEFTQNDT